MLDSGETSAVEEDVAWESEDDTLYVKPHSRRLSTYEAGEAMDLAVPVDLDDPQANTAEPVCSAGRSQLV